MKINLIFIAFFIPAFCLSQNTVQILNNSDYLKNGNKILIDFRNSEFDYLVPPAYQSIEGSYGSIELSDSLIFQLKGFDAYFYIKPFNPINYSIKFDYELIDDPLSEIEKKSYSEILKIIESIFDGPGTSGYGPPSSAISSSCSSSREEFIEQLEMFKIRAKEQITQQKVAEIFKQLKEIDFEDKQETKESIEKVEESINQLKQLLDEFDSDKTELFKCISEFDIADNDTEYLLKEMFKIEANKIDDDLSGIKDSFKLLLEIYLSVSETYKIASKGDGNKLKWAIPLKRVKSEKNKLAKISLIALKSGYGLNEEMEIVKTPESELAKKTFFTKKFKRFIPELSLGVAYTLLDYSTYETTQDTMGNMIVGQPINNELSQLNLSTMLNFNYFLPNSNILPFYQLGVGINSGIPTLLTGLGLRVELGTNALGISFGVATSWIRELDDLDSGDIILGQDDIERDLKFNFNWPPNAYFGIQYQF